MHDMGRALDFLTALDALLFFFAAGGANIVIERESGAARCLRHGGATLRIVRTHDRLLIKEIERPVVEGPADQFEPVALKRTCRRAREPARVSDRQRLLVQVDAFSVAVAAVFIAVDQDRAIAIQRRLHAGTQIIQCAGGVGVGIKGQFIHGRVRAMSTV